MTDQTPPVDAPEAPAPAPAPARRFVRVRDGRVIAGLFSGLGAYTGTDPVLWRVGFVAAVIFTGGLAIVGYIVAAFIVPEGDPGEYTAPPSSIEGTRWIGIGALVAGAAILVHNVWNLRGGIFWGLVLVGVGVALWVRAPGDDDAQPVPMPPSADPPSSPSPTTPGAVRGGGSGAITTPLAPPRTPPPPKRPRERSLLGRLVLGAAALSAGVAILLDNFDVIDITPRIGLSVVLAVIGVGLVVGAWRGRARWLIAPGIVLTVLVLGLTMLPAGFDGGFGEFMHRPDSAAEVRSEYRTGAGQLTVDLSAIDPADLDRRIGLRVGAGELLVIVPRDIDVEASARVGMGELHLFGRHQEGVGLRDRAVDETSGPGVLRLEMRVGMGELHLLREGSPIRLRRDDGPGPGFRFGTGFRSENG